jgi:hypothetical protein
MLPYKYKIGSIEARNYVLNNYEIKRLGCTELVRHANGMEFPIGTWRVFKNSVELEVITKVPEMTERERWAMEEICRVTKKRMENDLVCGG